MSQSELPYPAAALSDDQLDAVRKLESELGQKICLLAVERPPLFVLEAKTAPNQWVNIAAVYPQDEMPGVFHHREEAASAKSALKTLLAGKWKGRYKKHPIRVREV